MSARPQVEGRRPPRARAGPRVVLPHHAHVGGARCLPPPTRERSSPSARPAPHLHARGVAAPLLHLDVRQVGGQQVGVRGPPAAHARLVRPPQLRGRLRLVVRRAQRGGQLPALGAWKADARRMEEERFGRRRSSARGSAACAGQHRSLPCPSAPQRRPRLTRPGALPRLVRLQRLRAVGQGHRQLARPQAAHALRLLLAGRLLQQALLIATVHAPQRAALCRAGGSHATGSAPGHPQCWMRGENLQRACLQAAARVHCTTRSPCTQAPAPAQPAASARAPATCRPPAVSACSQRSRMRAWPALPPACTSGSKSRVNLGGGGGRGEEWRDDMQSGRGGGGVCRGRASDRRRADCRADARQREARNSVAPAAAPEAAAPAATAAGAAHSRRCTQSGMDR